MKAPLGWVKQYVDLKEDAASVARALVGGGVGIESIQGDVLDLEITANRPDLLSMLGVARELALLGRPRLKDPAVAFPESGAAGGVAISVEDPVFCPRYIGRVIRGVSTGPSPNWMQERLEAAGIRAINVVADITNYVMLECGEPLHAFDVSKIKGSRIIVRRARAGEKMTAIDGKEYTLTAADGVIADGERPVAIAGVMGGKDSEIGAGTKDVLLESAMFDPVSVRRTSRRLGLKSESSYRFERGVDWGTVEWASRRATALLVELAGGKPAPGAIDAAVAAPAPKKVTVRPSRVNRILGMNVEAVRLRAILEGLGCTIESADGDKIALIAPSTRRDLKEEVDFIEEVARIEGYDNIPTDIRMPVRVARPHPTDWVRDEIRSVLVASGAFEIVTSSFEEANATPLVTTWSSEPLIPLRNPDGFVDRTLRNSLTPALLTVLRTNEGSKEHLRTIFELAKIYVRCNAGDPHVDENLGGDKSPFDERMVLGIAAPTGFSDARGLVERILQRLQVAGKVVDGWVLVGATQIGTVSIPSLPGLALQAPVAVAEIDFASLVRLSKPVRKTVRHSAHPAITRDISMIFPESVPWAQIEQVVRSEGTGLLAGVALFDVFRDKKVGEGRKSMAFTLRYLAPDRTLAGSEVDPIMEAVRKSLGAQLGGQER